MTTTQTVKLIWPFHASSTKCMRDARSFLSLLDGSAPLMTTSCNKQVTVRHNDVKIFNYLVSTCPLFTDNKNNMAPNKNPPYVLFMGHDIFQFASCEVVHLIITLHHCEVSYLIEHYCIVSHLFTKPWIPTQKTQPTDYNLSLYFTNYSAMLEKKSC